jgi:UDP-N-acetylmuramate dehydrogenase
MNPVVSQQKFNELINLYPSMPHYDAPDGVKLAASWLIDQCGWRGKSLGPAGVYHKQALVLVNLGGATGADILKLAKCIVSDVEIKFGITLRMEAQVI